MEQSDEKTQQPPPYSPPIPGPSGHGNPGYSYSEQYGMQPVGHDTRQVVVVTQPAADPGKPSTSHMGLAFFVCLCCCCPAGLIAIICASQVNDYNNEGNWKAAKEASQMSYGCSFFGIAIGMISLIVVIVLAATGALYDF